MLDNLLEKIKSYNPNVDEELITKAFLYAEKHHEGQKRNSGEDYIIHPYNVALILADMNMDVPTIIGGLLHDVVEDTEVTLDDVKEEFGEEVANLVDGVTKLKNLNYKTKQENQAENIRKMVLAMAKDIRVIIVKLADRLHNMRTLEYMLPEKKREKAMETLEIYAPIADRLGMSQIKWELEDLSLRYLDPENYYKLVEMVNKKRQERESLINNMINEIQENLKKVGIVAEVMGRPKNFYSIYKKMTIKGRAFDEIYDLQAVRILVNDIKDCYGALGVVHTLWKPIPGRFKDYIAMPKSNRYQSLHTTIMDNQGETFEVQIRTYEMHQTAEYGIAAHWKYKSGATKSTSFDENLTWLRQLLEWQKDVNDPTDFVETLKIDFFADEIFIFTPRGDVINLPEGSTPIDFAYRIHSQVGNTTMGAKVNGRIVPINTKLKSGDIIEIITNSQAKPSLDWINFVASSQAKKKISQYFKVKDRDKNIERGREMIEREAKKLGYRVGDLVKDEWLEEVRAKLNIATMSDMYAAVGFGSVGINQVMAKLIDIYKRVNKVEPEIPTKVKERPQRNLRGGVSVKDIDNVKLRFAKCCNPVPGDEIVGYVTVGRGVSIHRKDCPNLSNEDPARMLEVWWNSEDGESYNAQIEVKASDRGNIVADVATKISDAKIKMVSLNARGGKDGIATLEIVVEIKDVNEIEKLIEKLKRVPNVFDVYRVKA